MDYILTQAQISVSSLKLLLSRIWSQQCKVTDSHNLEGGAPNSHAVGSLSARWRRKRRMSPTRKPGSERQLTGDIPFQRPRRLSVRTTFKNTANIPTRLGLGETNQTGEKRNLLDVLIADLPLTEHLSTWQSLPCSLELL